MSHYIVVAGLHGYLPSFHSHEDSEELGFTTRNEAIECLKEYANEIADSAPEQGIFGRGYVGSYRDGYIEIHPSLGVEYAEVMEVQ